MGDRNIAEDFGRTQQGAAELLPKSRSTFSHYDAVFHNGTFTDALKNSAIVAIAASVVLALVIGYVAAYVIGRFNFRGKQPACT